MASRDTVTFRVGTASCGVASGAAAVADALVDEARRVRARASVTEVGCRGDCYAEPLVDVILPSGDRICYGGLTPEAARRLVRRHGRPRTLAGRVRAMARNAMP